MNEPQKPPPTPMPTHGKPLSEEGLKAVKTQSKAVEVKKRHPAAIILNIILGGEAAVINGEEWRYQDGVFGIRREKWEDGVRQEDILLGVDMTVADFIKWCEKLPEETIIQAVFASVIAKERIRRF